MAPPYSTISTTTLRIPPSRFLTHLLLSLLAVLIPTVLHHWDVLVLIYIPAFPLTLLTNLLLYESGFVARPLSIPYCFSLSTCLAGLHHFTTYLRTYLLSHDGAGFGSTQHLAVHGALAFWVISEFEFYRVYAEFRGFETTKEVLKGGWKANSDQDFKVSREPYHFGYMSITVTESPVWGEVGI
jgi:hypothetical protein